MKLTSIGIFLLFLNYGYSQTKSKIIPIDKSILKLNEDTTSKIESTGKHVDFDYAIVINNKTNKSDTVLIYKELFVDKKRKSKN